jgi:hypothetical protein
MKNRKTLWQRILLPLLVTVLLALVASGCALLDSAARERQQENRPLTQGVTLGDVVTAEGIGEGNRPLQVTDTFSSSQDYIYVVAEADHIDQGTTMFARWFRNGEPFEDSSTITADRDYDNTYVEFHLEDLQSRMETGDYSVTLFVNGNPAETAEFTVQ